MTKYVHVPQGRSARFAQEVSPIISGIVGLYTFGFSTCNILISINENKVVLVHADMQVMHERIAEELKWVGEDAQLFLIFRNAYKQALVTTTLKAISALIPGKRIQLLPMDDAHDGVCVSFSNTQGDEFDGAHRAIRKMPIGENPKALIHHPKEQRFLAAQKIEQIVGLSQRAITQTITAKHISVFDGMQWEWIVDRELSVEAEHQLSRDEMGFFKQGDTYIVLCGKIGGIMEAARSRFPSLPVLGTEKEFIFPIAFWLEGYLNNFDEALLFKRNLQQLLDQNEPQSIFMVEQPQTLEDTNVCTQLRAALRSDELNIAERCDNIIEIYTSAPDNSFKKQLLDEYATFKRHYTERHEYTQAYATNASQIEGAMRLAQAGAAYMRNNNYSAARNLFRECLSLLVVSVEETDLRLATAFFNFGRAEQRCNNHEQARLLFIKALTLRSNFDKTEGHEQRKTKISSAIQECDLILGVSQQVERLRLGVL